MLTYLLNIAFAIAATVLYIQAPWTYSYDYCVTLMGCFIAQNVLFFATNKRKKRGRPRSLISAMRGICWARRGFCN